MKKQSVEDEAPLPPPAPAEVPRMHVDAPRSGDTGELVINLGEDENVVES